MGHTKVGKARANRNEKLTRKTNPSASAPTWSSLNF